MTIDLFQDPVCPWCRLGKHYLAQALTTAAAPAPAVRQRAYLLNGRLPPQGAEYRGYMLGILGSPARLDAALGRLTALGQAAGLVYHFDRIRFMPDSRLALRLLAAAPLAQQSAFSDRITQAYFELGQDIGDLAVLLALADDLGLDRPALRAAATAPATAAAVEDDLRQARALGITGVPAAVVAGRVVAGAQPADVWRQLLAQLAA